VAELVVKLSFATRESRVPPRHTSGFYSKAAYVRLQGERRDGKRCRSPNSQTPARSKGRMPNWAYQILSSMMTLL